MRNVLIVMGMFGLVLPLGSGVEPPLATARITSSPLVMVPNGV